MKSRLSYVICTTARSGSNLLSTTLAQTKIAGRPQEYFVPGFRDEFLRYSQFGIRDYRDYMRAFIQASTTQNGASGFNLHAVQGRVFIERASQARGQSFTSLRQALETTFPDLRYIFLVRKNKIAQAISHYRAVMTGEWRRFRDSTGSEVRLEFNQYGIKKSLRHLEISDTYWEEFFHTHNLSPLKLTYEELAANHEEVMHRVFNYLDVPAETPVPSPITKKMADDRSKAWEEEFIRLEKSDPVIVAPEKKIKTPF